MPTERKNVFLDADDSEGDSLDYNSEADELRKGGRAAKRRRVDSDESEDDEISSDEEHLAQEESNEADDDQGEEEEYPHSVAGESPKVQQHVDDGSDKSSIPPAAEKAAKEDANNLPKLSKPLTKKNLVATEAAIKKSGVVYISRVPPYMKPSHLRSLLDKYGALNRVFLAPEDKAAHARRVRGGGNRKKIYTEGWVEFVDKRAARRACELLNARTIGSKKGSFYRDDIWSLLYLKGFKWHHLTDQIAAENAERASRMRAEISKTTKENKEFVRNVERGKMLDGMESKKAAKRRKVVDEGKAGGDAEGLAREEGRRSFKQIPLAKTAKAKRENEPEQVQRVLGKIF